MYLTYLLVDVFGCSVTLLGEFGVYASDLFASMFRLPLEGGPLLARITSRTTYWAVHVARLVFREGCSLARLWRQVRFGMLIRMSRR